MQKTIKIDGMTCQHCSTHVREALEKIENVETVEVDLPSKSACITIKGDVSNELIYAAIEDEGYSVASIE